MGHNLGLQHDFYGDPYTTCRRDKDGSFIPCNQCNNYQPTNNGQPIGIVTGHKDDCCNGFLGYYDHPHVWSNCSVRDFEKHYISRNWECCMDKGKTYVFLIVGDVG